MTLKTHPDKSTHSTLRDQLSRERAAWTPALSRGDGLDVSESRRCVALGRRLSRDTNANGVTNDE